jgi:hypothetical protein
VDQNQNVSVSGSPAVVKTARFLRTAKRLGLYGEDEHPIMELEKMAGALYLSIFSSKEQGLLPGRRGATPENFRSGCYVI